MSLMDPTKVDSLILSETMRRILLRPYRFRQLLNTKSSSLMRQITRPMMFNSSYGRLLRNLVVIADSSSPATTKTKSSNLFTQDVQSLISPQLPRTNQNLPQVSSTVSGLYLRQKVLNMIQKFLLNL